MGRRRILLKLSGEALMGQKGFGVDPDYLTSIAATLKGIQQKGIQIGVVIGGGNIFRGIQRDTFGMERAPADHIGMLATVINGIALQQALRQQGAPCRVMSALGETDIVEPFIWDVALRYLDSGAIVLFVGGTGNPFFTTDTSAALRAAQINADLLLKATNVDGVYDRDPKGDPSARRYDRLTYHEALQMELRVMDAAAISICRDNGIPIKVFAVSSLERGIMEETFGTMITSG
ncbi:MAG: UMP kinase [Parachlamydiales bacterium]